MTLRRASLLTIMKWLCAGWSAILLVLSDMLQDWDIWDGPGLHPLWWGVFAMVGVTAVLWWMDRGRNRHADPWLCPSCGYDRRGLDPAAVCPECGASAPIK